jgi:hypothetical protein
VVANDWTDQQRAFNGIYVIVDDPIPAGKIATSSILLNDAGTIRARAPSSSDSNEQPGRLPVWKEAAWPSSTRLLLPSSPRFPVASQAPFPGSASPEDSP